MTERTFSLEEVAAEHLPADWKDGRRWLATRLNRKELRGVRFGRTWRMRASDVTYMLDRYSNEGSVSEPAASRGVCESAEPVLSSLSKRSRWRAVDAS